MLTKPMSLSSLAIAVLCWGAFAMPAFAETEDEMSRPSGPEPTSIPSDIVRDPTDLPPPIGPRAAQKVVLTLTTVEVTGQLADGTAYRYWTFDGKVPGPFLRVRVGDSVEVRLKNAADSLMMHNVDFHAVIGPGGGGAATMAAPGETKSFTFKAQHPGLYVYHCAIPPAAMHIAKGMYGLILVEPEAGLPKADREFYVMQGELYTEQPFGTSGELSDSYSKLMNETPEYYVFNGAVGGIATAHPLTAKVGEKIRIFFGNGGPNATSSFHVIGEIFDQAYQLGALTAPPLGDVQTITVPPGGSTLVDFKAEVPGSYMLVDHALSRAMRGLVGVLNIDGPQNPELFSAAQVGEGKAAAAMH